MTALIRRALLDRRKALLIWSASIGITGAFYMLLWPSIEDSVSKVISEYPAGIKEAFGITSLSTPEEYLNAELFSLILPVAIGIFALRAVSTAIAGAQERGYLDVLLSAPVSRRQLAMTTFAVIAIEVAAILLSAWALTCLGGIVAGADLSIGRTAAGYANVWPLAILSASIAMLITGVSQHSAVVSGTAGGTLVGMYLIDLLGRLADSIEPIRWLSVFRYYGAAAIDGIDPIAFAGITVAALALAAIGTVLFERRDLAG